MKQFLVATLVLMANVAVGQSYTYTAPIVPAMQDVTTMTTTVNAWVYKTGSCKLGSVVVGALSAPWCLGSSDNSVYRFDISKKQWIQQPQFGTSLHSIAVAGPSNVYSLQAVGHCGVYGGTQYYGVFRWIGSWSEDASLPCLSRLSPVVDGSMLFGIGFDNRTSQPALFYSSSNPGGTWPNVSWTLQTDGFISIQMGNGDVGCSVDANGGMWLIYAPSASQAPQQLPALPSGANRAVGCLYAENPVIAMAWTTTTGSVYSMPLENWGTWRQVTGISTVGLAGLSRYRIFGQDFSGKPYHWNVNAPGMAATYGGQWPTSRGCPQPNTPCNNPTTHTLYHTLQFDTCHGIHGCQTGQTTGLWSANLAVPMSDYNPQCDPYLGGGVDDPECHVTESANGHCNASGATLDPTGTKNYEVDDTIDVLDFSYNVNSDGPVRHQTVMYQGYYDGHVHNKVHDGCAVNDPVPACPVNTDIPDTLYTRVDWVGKLDDEARAYNAWHALQTDSVLGIVYPVVVHGWYLAQRLPGGSLVLVSCYGGWSNTDDLLWGDIFAAPACK